MAEELKPKNVNIYIDEAPLIDAYNKLSKKQDEYTKKIDDSRKKQQQLNAEIDKAKSAGKSYDSLSKDLNKVNKEISANEKALSKVNVQQKDLQKQIDSKTGPSLRQQAAFVRQLTNQYSNMSAGTVEAKKKLEELGKASSVLNQMKARLEAVTKAQQNSNGSSGFLNSFFGNLAANAVSKVSSLITGFFSGIKDEAFQAENSVSSLLNSLENAGRVDLFGRLLDQSEEFAERFQRLDNDDITDVFTKLIDYGKLTEKQIKETTEVIIDYAAKQKITLQESAQEILKGFEGNGKGLKTYGIALKDAGTFTERYNIIVGELGNKVRGAELAFEQTAQGGFQKWGQVINNLKEKIGTFFTGLLRIEEQQVKNAITAKREADQGTILVARYEELSKKANKTAAEKAELEKITRTLVLTFGSSIVEINKETGALTLNVSATKDLIKQKLLLANSKAAELASKLNAAQEKQIEANRELAIQTDLQIAKEKELGVTVEEVNDLQFSGRKNQKKVEEDQGLRTLFDIGVNAKKAKQQTETLGKEIKGLTKDLEELGFKADDVNKLFNPGDTNKPVGAPVKPPSAGVDPAIQQTIDDLKKLHEELLKLQESSEFDTPMEKEIIALEQKFRELVKLAHGHQDELKKIEEQKQIELAEIRVKYFRLDLKADDQNWKELAVQIRKQDEEKIKRAEETLEKVTNLSIKALSRIANLPNVEEIENRRSVSIAGLKALKARGLQRIQANKELLEAEMAQALDAKNLTEQEKEKIEFEFNERIKNDRKKIITDTIQGVLDYAQRALNIITTLNDARNQRETAQLNKELAGYDAKKKADQRLLNNKLISQQEYNKRIAGYDTEAEKRKEELDKKQFERNRKIQVAQALINGAQAITKAIAEYAFPFSLIPIAFDVATTAAQVSAINKQKFEDGGVLSGPSHKQGGMSVINPRTGKKEAEVEGGEVILSKKTVRNNRQVVGSLLNSSMYQNGRSIAPFWKNQPYKSIDVHGLSRAIQTVRHFENGGVFSSSTSQNANSTGAGSIPVISAMTEDQQALLQALLKRLETPIIANVVLRDIERANEQVNSIKNDAIFK